MSESIFKRALAAIKGKLAVEPELVPEEKPALSEIAKKAILDSFDKQDELMKRFENGEVSVEEVERGLRRIEIERMAEQSRTESTSTVKLSPSTKAVITRVLAETIPSVAEEPPKRTKSRRFKFDGRIAWAWEVENSVTNMDDLNALLVANKKASEDGQAMAESVFEMMARNSTDETFKKHMDEDGADVPLPSIPYSPYTDEGAAFMVSLAYAWRSMAEEWNMVESQRQKELKDIEAQKRANELSEYLTTSVDAMIKQELERKERDRNDKLDALAGLKLPQRIMIPSHEGSGVSKIAAGISMGQLPKSKF